VVVVITAEKWKDGSLYYDTAEVAKIIRFVLKREFPRTKFSVRLRRFAGGSSVDVHYDKDGAHAPKKADVESHIKNFVNHDFDGMTDSSVYLTHWMTPDYKVTLATRDAMTFQKAIKNPKPSKDAMLVHFGAGFVCVQDWYPSN
jgi:hypothetical protein